MTMPAIFSQPRCCHAPTAKSSNPTKPGSQHRFIIREIANGASRMFLIFSDISIRLLLSDAGLHALSRQTPCHPFILRAIHHRSLVKWNLPPDGMPIKNPAFNRKQGVKSRSMSPIRSTLTGKAGTDRTMCILSLNGEPMSRIRLEQPLRRVRIDGKAFSRRRRRRAGPLFASGDRRPKTRKEGSG